VRHEVPNAHSAPHLPIIYGIDICPRGPLLEPEANVGRCFAQTITRFTVN
jgi:hypothetical protein